jgi:hypothetical protein
MPISGFQGFEHGVFLSIFILGVVNEYQQKLPLSGLTYLPGAESYGWNLISIV